MTMKPLSEEERNQNEDACRKLSKQVMDKELIEKCLLTPENIGDNLDLYIDGRYPCSDGSSVITVSVDKLLEAQHAKTASIFTEEIANRLNEPCPNDGEEIYKCPRCVRQLMDELLAGKVPNMRQKVAEEIKRELEKEMSTDRGYRFLTLGCWEAYWETKGVHKGGIDE